MRVFIYIFICLSIYIPTKAYAGIDDLAIQVANDHIDVTVGFNGSSIELFGDRRDVNTHVAIVVQGPRKKVTLWKKMRVMGAWVNRFGTDFQEFPIYYHYALDEALKGEQYKQTLLENGIGHKGLQFVQKSKIKGNEKHKGKFYEALVEKNVKAGTFFEKSASIQYINENFFRVSFPIPPSAATGEYSVTSYLIHQDGKVVEQAATVLRVEQVGVNAFIFDAAQNYSFIYAVVCIVIAMISGWLVSVLRLRP